MLSKVLCMSVLVFLALAAPVFSQRVMNHKATFTLADGGGPAPPPPPVPWSAMAA